jgi:hypothetical protein
VNAARILAALEIPAKDRVDQRVPKKLLMENAAVAAGDKTLLLDAIEEIQWVAVFKPASIGAPEFRDKEREYLEVAVLNVQLRKDVRVARIAELIHRAIPYPVLLLLEHGNGCLISAAHKRWAQNDATKMVLDEAPTDVWLDALADEAESVLDTFLQSLPLSGQPRTHLKDLYQGWIDRMTALHRARMTGTFRLPNGFEHAQEVRASLQRCREIDVQVSNLHNAAVKEKQVPRQVAMNLEIKALRQERERLVSSMNGT